MQPKVSYTNMVDEQPEVSNLSVEKDARGSATVYWIMQHEQVVAADLYTSSEDESEGAQGLGDCFANLWFTPDSTRIDIHTTETVYRITDRSVDVPSRTKAFVETVLKEAFKTVREHRQSEYGDE